MFTPRHAQTDASAAAASESSANRSPPEPRAAKRTQLLELHRDTLDGTEVRHREKRLDGTEVRRCRPRWRQA